MGSTVRDRAALSGNQCRQHFGPADSPHRIEITGDPSYTAAMDFGGVDTVWSEVHNAALWFTVGTSVNKAFGADWRTHERTDAGTMRQMRRSVSTALAAVVVASPTVMLTAGMGTAAADSTNSARTTFLPFAQIQRRCDHSANMYTSPTGYGRATAVVRSSGSTVSADVQLVTARPDTRYDVRLIQTPRASSASCNGGDPGVVAGALQTDGAGSANVTLQGPIASGATKAWVYISLPGEFTQTPAEYYTTDYEAAI